MNPQTISLLAFSVFCVSASGQESVATLLERKLLTRLQQMDAATAGVLGVVAIDLNTGAVLQHNANALFPQASSIKIPIMAEVFRQAEAGKIDLSASVTLQSSDAAGGSGDLQSELKKAPVRLPVRELIEKMIRDSDNTATNRLIAMAGMDSINQWIGTAGMKHTKLQRVMMDSRSAKQDRENISTPMEMARLAEMLYRGRAVSSEASKSMIAILKLVKADFRSTVPKQVEVAAKPGELDGVRAETGIIFLPNRPFVLSVMSTFLDDKTNPIPAVTDLIYRHFEKLAASNRYGHKLQ